MSESWIIKRISCNISNGAGFREYTHDIIYDYLYYYGMEEGFVFAGAVEHAKKYDDLKIAEKVMKELVWRNRDILYFELIKIGAEEELISPVKKVTRWEIMEV